MREGMGERWKPFAAYNLDRARTPSVQAALHALMEQFAMPAIPPGDLARINVPTTLIWGRHDLATPLQVAQAASTRYGWPLHVIENCADDPPIEQPEAFLEKLRIALGTSTKQGATTFNFQTADEDEQRVRATYGVNFDRLVEVKKKYDPDNVFRSNRNIRPRARAGNV